jgi:hypothetical protein
MKPRHTSKPSRRPARMFRVRHPRGRSAVARKVRAADPQYVSPFPSAADRAARKPGLAVLA